MADIDQEHWEAATAVVLSVLKMKVSGIGVDLDKLGQKVDTMVGRFNNGFHTRLVTVELQIKAFNGIRRWLMGIVSALILMIIAAFFTNYTAMQNKNSQLERQMDRIERQLQMMPRPSPPYRGEP